MRHRLALLCGAALVASWAQSAIAQDCGSLQGQDGAVRIDAASRIDPAPAWNPDETGLLKARPVHVPLCRVEGTIEGSIGFELWLPMGDRWKGRLLAAGVGGDAGVFNYNDMSRRVEEGFATVTTDSGHKITQARWMSDPRARSNYEHRATHLTLVAAKKILARFYGRPADHSYFLGCSGGGRQGLKEMENYPGDFDGIVSGAPGPNMPLISTRMMWLSLAQKRNPAAALSDADWALYESAVIRACDGADGVTDGIVENPLRCGFKPRALLCPSGQNTACLSPAKLAMIEQIIAPMPDENGHAMDQGLLPGVRTRPGPPSPLLRAMWADAVYDNPNWDENSFSRSRDLALVNAAMPELRADRVAIGPFIARGGKAIIYQGWQDPSVIAGPTIRYYARLASANGGAARLSRSVRLMMVPGMYHCQGGPGADQFGGSGQTTAPSDATHDILWAVIDWVERRKAPDELIATKADRPGFSRLLCAFPRRAAPSRAEGRDTADAFECAPDGTLAAQLELSTR